MLKSTLVSLFLGFISAPQVVLAVETQAHTDCLAGGGVWYFDGSCRVTNADSTITVYRPPTSTNEQALAGAGGYVQTNWSPTTGFMSETFHHANGDLTTVAVDNTGEQFTGGIVSYNNGHGDSGSFGWGGSIYCALWNCRQGESLPPPAPDAMVPPPSMVPSF